MGMVLLVAQLLPGGDNGALEDSIGTMQVSAFFFIFFSSTALLLHAKQLNEGN
jgi:hypothetical protein